MSKSVVLRVSLAGRSVWLLCKTIEKAFCLSSWSGCEYSRRRILLQSASDLSQLIRSLRTARLRLSRTAPESAGGASV